eukprot:1157582-Pelagomonas_calceolata.AAC.5
MRVLASEATPAVCFSVMRWPQPFLLGQAQNENNVCITTLKRTKRTNVASISMTGIPTTNRCVADGSWLLTGCAGVSNPTGKITVKTRMEKHVMSACMHHCNFCPGSSVHVGGAPKQ